MPENEESSKEGGGLEKIMYKAAESLGESVSSLAASVADEGRTRLNDFSLNVCREHLDRMAKEQSTVAAAKAAPGFCGVSMSPMIDGMLNVCPLTAGDGGGCTWVVCAPTEQGKTMAAQFLIHGNHKLRPKRSLKIDATNMTNFPKDFAKILNCSAAEPIHTMSQLLCQALSDSAPTNEPGEGKIAKATATMTGVAGQYICNPGNAIPLSTPIEMRDAEKHDILRMTPFTVSGAPSPILIIDDFFFNTKQNEDFIRALIRDASAQGVIVFLMTRDKDWASKLIQLNGGTKCKPLPTNVDNPGYSGDRRFAGEPKWNGLYWPVEQLRDYVRPFCEKHKINPSEAIPDDAKLTPGEANTIVLSLAHKKRF